MAVERGLELSVFSHRAVQGEKDAVGHRAKAQDVRADQRVSIVATGAQSVKIGDLLGYAVCVMTALAKEGVGIGGKCGKTFVDVEQKDAVSALHERVGDQTSRGQRDLAFRRETACQNNDFQSSKILSKNGEGIFILCP